MKERSFLVTFFIILSAILVSCEKDPTEPKPDDDNIPTGQFGLGLIPAEDRLSEIPLAPFFGFGNTNLPVRYDLTQYLSPIGNQGEYGTCVGWAVGYNARTPVYARDHNLSTADLKSTKNQFSPKDIYISMEDKDKNTDCSGSIIPAAIEKMITRGIATMATVPYSGLNYDCSIKNLKVNWTTEAAKYKISNYRQIEGSVNSIKENIYKGNPVIFGARLSDNFMYWNSDAVLSSNTTYEVVGMHAGHAMTIIGYDDSKGAGGAFRVVNSWGSDWGDKGFIWIDYRFFLNEFVPTYEGYGQELYIITTDKNKAPNEDPRPAVGGVDLTAWIYSDRPVSSTSRGRQLVMNVFNIGTEPAKASDRWSVRYMYYNAYDLTDYGLIFYDEFTPSTNSGEIMDCVGVGHCKYNIDLPGGSNMAAMAFGTDKMFRNYTLPALTGDYYLALIVDAENVYDEADKNNNTFYATREPIRFEKGIVATGKSGSARSASPVFEVVNNERTTKDRLKMNPNNSAVTSSNPNAYNSSELRSLIRHEKESDGLQEKLQNILSDIDPRPFPYPDFH